MKLNLRARKKWTQVSLNAAIPSGGGDEEGALAGVPGASMWSLVPALPQARRPVCTAQGPVTRSTAHREEWSSDPCTRAQGALQRVDVRPQVYLG